MSIEAMAWAFRQNIPKPGAKLVLLALCDFADEAWSCFPGQATLAAKTSQGERTVRRHLEWLEEEGFIVSHARFSDGRRTSNRYTIHAPRAQTPPPSSSPTPGSGTPAPKAARGGKQGGGKQGGGKRTMQAAKTATGQSDQRPDSAGEPAKLAGEPSENHQRSNPLPPADGDGRQGTGGCAAHPDSPAANCRSCGTSPRARRAAAAAREKREKDQRARDRDRRWFEEQRERRTRAAELEAQGAVDRPRQAAREAIRRDRPRGTKPR
ncbi:helix-turn-helix domain-containing protein [Streptomyces sp. bgisy060]|uniref:helix-turn-helix domain-containing protein n=1 Tax=Streptomyces sp. bgisy060 TaxID=3413775 RepID=UPI003EBD9B78